MHCYTNGIFLREIEEISSDIAISNGKYDKIGSFRKTSDGITFVGILHRTKFNGSSTGFVMEYVLSELFLSSRSSNKNYLFMQRWKSPGNHYMAGIIMGAPC